MGVLVRWQGKVLQGGCHIGGFVVVSGVGAEPRIEIAALLAPSLSQCQAQIAAFGLAGCGTPQLAA